MSEDTRTRRAVYLKVTCPCGAVFEARASRIARGDGKYCSRACYYKFRPTRRSEYVWVTCPCGVKFEVTAGRVAGGHGKYCSKDCRYRYLKPTGNRTPYFGPRPNPNWFKPTPESEHQTPEEKAAYSREWKRNNPDKVKAQWTRRLPQQKIDWLRRAHGLTPDDLRRLFKAQGGRCYLCEKPLSTDMKNVHVEHDHRCCPSGRSCPRCRRGLACLKCNSIAGLASDDPALLRRIADNLEAANASCTLLGLED